MHEEITSLCEEVKGKLLEHVDSVRIFVTFHEGATENTKSYSLGGGNFYAQLGLVREWLTRQDEYVRKDANKEDSQ